MVPVPYVIGATTDLVSELSPSTLEDVYLVDVDAKKVSTMQWQTGMMYFKPISIVNYYSLHIVGNFRSVRHVEKINWLKPA